MHHDHFTTIVETSYEDDLGYKTYGLPEKYARIVAFQNSVPSSVIGDERMAFKKNDYKINEDDVIPWVPCSEKHLSKLDPEKLEGVLLTLENS